MSEFEKIAILYLAHQSFLLHTLLSREGTEREWKSIAIDTQELRAAIRKHASPETLEMLGDAG